jgi:hypothetical protein
MGALHTKYASCSPSTGVLFAGIMQKAELGFQDSCPFTLLLAYLFFELPFIAHMAAFY